MDEQVDEGPLTRRAHAEGLAPDVLALDAVRGMADTDDALIEDVIERVAALTEAGGEPLEQFQSRLCYWAVTFGREAFGSEERLLEVLGEHRAALVAHIDGYEPPTAA